jgi:hypothetical protein
VAARGCCDNISLALGFLRAAMPTRPSEIGCLSQRRASWASLQSGVFQLSSLPSRELSSDHYRSYRHFRTTNSCRQSHNYSILFTIACASASSSGDHFITANRLQRRINPSQLNVFLRSRLRLFSNCKTQASADAIGGDPCLRSRNLRA